MAFALGRWWKAFRANFRNDVRTRTSLDVNELIRETLALEHGDLEKHRILVQIRAEQAAARGYEEIVSSCSRCFST